MRTICGIIFAAVLGGVQASVAAPDFRPPFDKGDYKGTVAIQANPWFPLYKPPMNALGGPNMAYLKPRTADWWGETKLVPGQWTRIAVVYDLRKVCLFIDGSPAAHGRGKSKKQAEQLAAREALKEDWNEF